MKHQAIILAFAGGALVGGSFAWAITADRAEARAKRHQAIMENMLRKQSEALAEETTKNVQLSRMMSPNDDFDPLALKAWTEGVIAEETAGVPDDFRHPDAIFSSEKFEDNLDAATTLSEITEVISVEDEVIHGVIPLGETPEETESNLRRIIREYTEDDNADEFVNRHAQFAENIDVPEPPYVISREVWAYSEEGDPAEDYNKLELHYYPTERTLLDEDQDPIDDPNMVVGWQLLETGFGADNWDANVMFVRNSRLRTDYEVVKIEGEPLPMHVRYGFGREEFAAKRAAGVIVLREEDLDRP